MCADQNLAHRLENGKSEHANGPLSVAVTIDINDIYDGALKVLKRIRPFWPINNVKFKVFTDGTTNKLIGCCIPKHSNNDEISLENDDNMYHYNVILIRTYGKNTEVLIDRKKEISNFELLHKYGFAPQLLATFTNGLAYEYTDGKPVSKSKIYEEHVWRQVAKRMAEMHRDIKCNYKENANGSIESCQPVLWTKIQNIFDLIPTKYADPIKQQSRESLLPSMEKLKIELNQLKDVVSKIKSPVVFAHNDLLLGNILYNDCDNRVIFIDYEYADYNYQAYDIGNHFAEFAGMTDIDYALYPPKEFQLKWIKEYLTHYHLDDGTIVNDEYVHRLYADVNKFALVAHFFWLLWGHVQAEYSEIDYDYLERFRLFLGTRDNMYSLMAMPTERR